MLNNSKEAIAGSLKPMISEARRKKLWLHAHYHNIWMSPDELEHENAQGKFLWDPINWTLRDPAEYVAEAAKAVERSQAELARVIQKVAGVQ